MNLNKKDMKNLMLLILFAVVVYVGIQRADVLLVFARFMVGIAYPFLLGAAFAFVLKDVYKRQGKCYLKLEYHLKNATRFRPEGFKLGFDEIQLQTKDMRNQKAVKMLEVTEESGEAGKEAGQPPVFSVAQDDRNLFVSTDKFSYTYDKLTGLFSELSYVNCKVLERPMEYNIWRAPTDNDRNIKNIWRKAKYDKIVTRAYRTDYTVLEEEVQIHTVLSVSAVIIQRILDIDATWTIRANGRIDVKLDVKKDPEFPELPRFGLRLFLPRDMADITYYGLGPVESYQAVSYTHLQM